MAPAALSERLSLSVTLPAGSRAAQRLSMAQDQPPPGDLPDPADSI